MAVDLVLKVTQFEKCCVECGGQPLSEEHDTASSGPDPNIMMDSSQGLLSNACVSLFFHVCFNTDTATTVTRVL